MIIITDTAADITAEQARQLDIQIVPIRIRFGKRECPMDSEEDFDAFFDQLKVEKELPQTSQPSPEEYLKLFQEAEKKKEEVLVVTLSSGLSGTINAANLAKEICGYKSIWIVDSEQAITTQRYLVEQAVQMRKEGKKAGEIAGYLEMLRGKLTVCGMLDTLTYLKKGGRIPAALAFLGNTLHIKPVIELRDRELVMLGKARGRKGAMQYLWKEFESSRFDENHPVYFGYTRDKKFGMEFMKLTQERYGLKNCRLLPVGGVIGTHVGPSCIAISFVHE
ncbi:MAG: DegV family protein [Ruminococcus sp.]|jgi:DegV family protein with EDD domain